MAAATGTGPDDEFVLLGLHDDWSRAEVLGRALQAAINAADTHMIELAVRCAGAMARHIVDWEVEGDAPLLFHAVAKAAPTHVIGALLACGASPSCRQRSSKESALHAACAAGYSAAVDLLLEFGADLSPAKNRTGETPVASALRARPHLEDHCLCVSSLLQAGAPADGSLTRMRYRRLSQLHVAVLAGCVTCVSSLIARGADLNARTKGRDAAVHLAASAGENEIVACLVHAHANVELRNDASKLPVHLSAAAAAADSTALLLSRCAAAVNARAQGITPLHCLALSVPISSAGSDPELRLRTTAEVLLKARADPQASDAHGWTALQLAAKFARAPAPTPTRACALELCAVLIANGVPVDAVTLQQLRGASRSAGGHGSGQPQDQGAHVMPSDPVSHRGGGIASLRELCEDELARIIDHTTVADLHDVATGLGLARLARACEEYILCESGVPLEHVRRLLDSISGFACHPHVHKPPPD